MSPIQLDFSMSPLRDVPLGLFFRHPVAKSAAGTTPVNWPPLSVHVTAGSWWPWRIILSTTIGRQYCGEPRPQKTVKCPINACGTQKCNCIAQVEKQIKMLPFLNLEDMFFNQKYRGTMLLSVLPIVRNGFPDCNHQFFTWLPIHDILEEWRLGGLAVGNWLVVNYSTNKKSCPIGKAKSQICWNINLRMSWNQQKDNLQHREDNQEMKTWLLPVRHFFQTLKNSKKRNMEPTWRLKVNISIISHKWVNKVMHHPRYRYDASHDNSRSFL